MCKVSHSCHIPNPAGVIGWEERRAGGGGGGGGSGQGCGGETGWFCSQTMVMVQRKEVGVAWRGRECACVRACNSRRQASANKARSVLPTSTEARCGGRDGGV